MPGPPAHCSHCGEVFLSRQFNFEMSIDATLDGCSETCPRCGKMADVLDGTYDFVGNAITIRKASPRTVEILTALQEAARAAQAGKSKDEVLAPLKKQSPELAKAGETVVAKRGMAILAAALIVCLQSCKVDVHATIDLNRFIDQMYAIARGNDPPSHTPEARSPPPPKTKQSTPVQAPEQQRNAVISCPRTHRPVPTGLSFTEFRFSKASLENKVVARCRECGGTHVWSKKDAYLD